MVVWLLLPSSSSLGEIEAILRVLLNSQANKAAYLMQDKTDEELASEAYVLRKRAEHGDHTALKQAQRIEGELRRRLGPTPSSHMPLTEPPKRRPWWRFWEL